MNSVLKAATKSLRYNHRYAVTQQWGDGLILVRLLSYIYVKRPLISKFFLLVFISDKFSLAILRLDVRQKLSFETLRLS